MLFPLRGTQGPCRYNTSHLGQALRGACNKHQKSKVARAGSISSCIPPGRDATTHVGLGRAPWRALWASNMVLAGSISRFWVPPRRAAQWSVLRASTAVARAGSISRVWIPTRRPAKKKDGNPYTKKALKAAAFQSPNPLLYSSHGTTAAALHAAFVVTAATLLCVYLSRTSFPPFQHVCARVFLHP